jgi:hypothetical protein
MLYHCIPSEITVSFCEYVFECLVEGSASCHLTLRLTPTNSLYQDMLIILKRYMYCDNSAYVILLFCWNCALYWLSLSHHRYLYIWFPNSRSNCNNEGNNKNVKCKNSSIKSLYFEFELSKKFHRVWITCQIKRNEKYRLFLHHKPKLVIPSLPNSKRKF